MKMKKNLTGYPSIDKTHEENLSYMKKNPIIPDMSISNAITLINMFNLNGEAVDMVKSSFSYAEMERDKMIVARALKEFGVKKGDIITVCMNNTYQAIVVFLAANTIGAVTTFLNYRASDDEVKHYLNEFSSRVFFNYDKDAEYNSRIKESTKLETIVTLSKSDLYNKKIGNTNESKTFGYNDFVSYDDLKSIAAFFKQPFNVLYGGKNDALLLYTSGTSGAPKTVVLTNENVLANGIYCKNTINLPQSRNERCLSFVPFKYPYGFATSVLLTFLCGRSVVLTPEGLNKENAKDILKNINYYYGSPALADQLINITPENFDLSAGHAFVTGGDFFTDKDREKSTEFFHKHNNDHIEFNEGAGNAETVATWSSSVGNKYKPGTVGKILTGTSPMIVDPETMEEKKYNEEGTLLIAGKHVFSGYYNNREATEKEFVYRNGKKYFNTRTTGSLDEEGYFTLTGRESRFYILSDGNKVYCEKVQKFLNLIDVVDSCVVVEKPNSETRFENKAYIVLKDGIEPSEDIKQYIFDMCKREMINSKNEVCSLSPFEIPSSLEFVEKIQLTEADKIDFTYYQEKAKEEYESHTSSVLNLKI